MRQENNTRPVSIALNPAIRVRRHKESEQDSQQGELLLKLRKQTLDQKITNNMFNRKKADSDTKQYLI